MKREIKREAKIKNIAFKYANDNNQNDSDMGYLGFIDGAKWLISIL